MTSDKNQKDGERTRRSRGSRGGSRSRRRGGSRQGSGQDRRGQRDSGSNRQSTGQRATRGNQGQRGQRRDPAPAPQAPTGSKAAATRPQRSPHTGALALSAWDLSRTRKQVPDSARGQIMTLRTHQKLLTSFEAERAIPERDQSFLRVREGARGSCLLVHGVSTRPGDLHELASVLYENGFNVYVLRLPDYGTPGHTISEVSWESSLMQVRQCLRLLSRGGGKVHVVGLGFGATLSLHLASQETVSSLVLLAPAIMPRESFFQRLLVRMRLHRVSWIHGLLGWNADLMEGMDRARGKIGRIRVPIYAAQCDDDDRACPSSLRFLQRKARNSASRFQVFAEGGHAILKAHGDRVLYREIVRFCEG